MIPADVFFSIKNRVYRILLLFTVGVFMALVVAAAILGVATHGFLVRVCSAMRGVRRETVPCAQAGGGGQAHGETE